VYVQALNRDMDFGDMQSLLDLKFAAANGWKPGSKQRET
jgi:hypothetical protein